MGAVTAFVCGWMWAKCQAVVTRHRDPAPIAPNQQINFNPTPEIASLSVDGLFVLHFLLCCCRNSFVASATPALAGSYARRIGPAERRCS